MSKLRDPLASPEPMEKAKARNFRFYVQQQDWFLWVLIVLAAVGTYLVDKYLYHTNRRFEVTDTTIAYQHNEDTIAFWLAPLVPAVVFIFHMAYWELTKTHLPWGHRFSSIFRFFTSALAALAVVGFHTELFKTLCGRLRPDFLDRCYDENDVILANGTVTVLVPGNSEKCTSTRGLEDDGRKSFPSGHSSCTLAVSMYAAYYVLWCLHFRVGKLGNKGYHNKMYMDGSSCAKRLGMQLLSFMDILLMLFQLAWAWGVGVSRFMDNRHHASDIIAGFVLAMTFTPLFLLRTISQQGYWDHYIMDAARKQEGDEFHADCRPARKDPSTYDLEAPIPRHQHTYSDSNTGFGQYAKPGTPQHMQHPQQQQPYSSTQPSPPPHVQHHQQQQSQHSIEQLPPHPATQASWAAVPGSVPSPDTTHAVQMASQQPVQESCFATNSQPNGTLSVTSSTAPLVPSGTATSDSMAPPPAAAVVMDSMGSGGSGGFGAVAVATTTTTTASAVSAAAAAAGGGGGGGVG